MGVISLVARPTYSRTNFFIKTSYIKKGTAKNDDLPFIMILLCSKRPLFYTDQQWSNLENCQPHCRHACLNSPQTLSQLRRVSTTWGDDSPELGCFCRCFFSVFPWNSKQSKVKVRRCKGTIILTWAWLCSTRCEDFSIAHARIMEQTLAG